MRMCVFCKCTHTFSYFQMVQVAAQPPRSLLSARDVSTFVVIQSDNTVQAWNPDHMDNDVEQMKYNPTGSLVAMATASGGNRVIAYGSSRPWLGTITDINKGTNVDELANVL